MKTILIILALFIIHIQVYAQNSSSSRFGLAYTGMTLGISKGNFQGFNNYLKELNNNPNIPAATLNGRFGHHAGMFLTIGLNAGFRLGIRGLQGELHTKTGGLGSTATATQNSGKPYKYQQNVDVGMVYYGGGLHQNFRTGNGFFGVGMSYDFTRYSLKAENEATEQSVKYGKQTSVSYTPYIQYTFSDQYPLSIRFSYSINHTMMDYSKLNQFSNSAPEGDYLKSNMSSCSMEISIPFYSSLEPERTHRAYSKHNSHHQKHKNHHASHQIPGGTPVKNQTKNTTIKQQELSQKIKLSGKTLDKKTGKATGAELILTNSKTGYVMKTESDPVTGRYELSIDTAGTYTLISKSKGHINREEKITLISGSAVTKDVYMEPVQAGQSFRIENIRFEKGNDHLLPGSYSSLDHLAEFLTLNPSVEIELGGHTSSEGDPKANLILSEKRAGAVKEYLLSKGIEPGRIRVKGYGSSKPVLDNNSEEHRAVNRRVEYRIIKK